MNSWLVQESENFFVTISSTTPSILSRMSLDRLDGASIQKHPTDTWGQAFDP